MLTIVLWLMIVIMNLYEMVMIADVIMSWLPNARLTKVGKVIHSLSSIYLGKFRGILVIGILDFTTIIGFVLYNLFLSGMVSLLGA
ncbi:MAG TPA: YggT family protein [Bacilli bacterium]|jgi:YggT family protein|nr:YggT family protein [Bacilli bacterium]HPX83384.1 YggT family protein [Bacilli bacterium]HQB80282.1 YggT family protein [Bacilli bacterium]HQO94007.1 YggT family protein [Bacilli bacterium]HQQ39571.1 YggT family protein [Bacilli bacterium]